MRQVEHSLRDAKRRAVAEQLNEIRNKHLAERTAAAEQLKEEHLVTKLPTLLVVDGDGKSVARLVQPHISEVRMVAKSMFKPKAVTDGDF